MKKLNRKGFTLVELLAVIIILAIVVGITVPAVLTTVDKAKKEAFQTAADSAADWLDRQYQSYLIGDADLSVVDDAYTDSCGGGDCTSSDALIIAAGLKSSNVDSLTATKNGSGRYCVTLVAKSGGDYDGVVTGNSVTGGNC